MAELDPALSDLNAVFIREHLLQALRHNRGKNDPLQRPVEWDTVEHLLSQVAGDHTVVVNMKIEDGMSPLHVAALEGNASMCEYFIYKGANPNSRDIYRRTPLDVAAIAAPGTGHSYYKCVQKLLEGGATVHNRQWNGDTVLTTCCRGNKEGLLAILLNHGANVNPEIIFALNSDEEWLPGDIGPVCPIRLETPLEFALWNLNEMMTMNLVNNHACSGCNWVKLHLIAIWAGLRHSWGYGNSERRIPAEVYPNGPILSQAHDLFQKIVSRAFVVDAPTFATS
jgi:hypothetical protein